MILGRVGAKEFSTMIQLRSSSVLLSLFLVACTTTTGDSEGNSGGAGGASTGGAETGGGETGGGGAQAICPADDNAAVHYISHDPAQCDQTDCGGESDCRPCTDGQEYFSSPECGCGCIDAVLLECPDAADPTVHYIATDYAACPMTDCGGESDCIPCDPDQTYFESPACGCGCVDITTDY
jgi:hypothetical protein